MNKMKFIEILVKPYFLPGRFRSTIIIHFIAAPAPWILFYSFYSFYLFSCGGLGAGNAIIIHFIARRLGAGPFP